MLLEKNNTRSSINLKIFNFKLFKVLDSTYLLSFTPKHWQLFPDIYLSKCGLGIYLKPRSLMKYHLFINSRTNKRKEIAIEIRLY